MPVLMTSDLKQRAGEILDAAVNEPQFVFRAGHLLMISPVEPSDGPRVFPEGWFADAYPQPKDRAELEASYSNLPQTPQR
jgi:hypothetical protein